MITTCPQCGAGYTDKELDHVLCRKCAEAHLFRVFGYGLALPPDWYPKEPKRVDE